jgi:stage II sporulation protein D
MENARVSVMLDVMPSQPSITVLLFAHERPAALAVSSAQAWELRGPSAIHRIAAGQTVHVRLQVGRLEAEWGRNSDTAGAWNMRGAGTWTIRAKGRTLKSPGALQITPDGQALSTHIRVPIKTYLPGVMAAEFDSDNPNALEAMAICVRSFTRRALATPRHGRAATCDATHCQRFRPQERTVSRIEAAFQATRGQFRAWRDKVAETLWHAACGGRGSSALEAFQRQDVPYLVGGPDIRPSGRAWCDTPPGRWQWQTEITRDQWRNSLARAGLSVGTRTEPILRIVARGHSGRVARIQWGASAAQTLDAPTFWTTLGPTLGWKGLRSLHFDVSETATGWHVSGTGLGHGVGLCQAGAEARARAGWSREAILSAYFPGTRSIYTPEMP